MDSIYLLDCVKATENALDLVGVYLLNHGRSLLSRW